MEHGINELIELTKDNNRMLKEIITFINLMGKNANNENAGDMLRNIIANLVSNKIDGNFNNN